MNREEKAQLLSELQDMFNNSEAVVVSHYKGLTVQAVSELRNKIRSVGAEFKVTKNRITRLALKGTKFEGLADLFAGPTAVAFANDPVAVSKICVEFGKTNENFIVLGGATGTVVLSLSEVNTYASLPTMDELRAKLIGLLQAPASQVARVLAAYSEKEAA
ncbi:MAG: 50S ribosomal protein L10 [Lactobacillaceae bacterium]|nr:50S ribosomal protein L10 [Lactobacillaceae bacterium]